MRKIIALMLATILICVTMIGIDMHSQNVITNKDSVANAYKLNSDQRNNSKGLLKSVLDNKTAVILGSSELSASDKIAYPSYLFGNSGSGFKMLLFGKGYTQCIHHATAVGAYSDILPDHKVVLILSPQWFSSAGLDSTAYASRFSESLYLQMMKNPMLSDALKQRITDRLQTLLSADPKQLSRINLYEKEYLGHNLNLFKAAEVALFRKFMDFKNDYVLSQELSAQPPSDGVPIKSSNIDFDKLIKKAKAEGNRECTRNDFGIYDQYYDTYIKDSMAELKDSNVAESYAESPEYDDFRIFLDVCKELKIDPLVTIVPVNGRWYDYTGFPKEGRESYYKKIKDMCDEYGVQTADFSDKEYEKYFLKDIMHMGWKGWVYFDEAVYNFYNK